MGEINKKLQELDLDLDLDLDFRNSLKKNFKSLTFPSILFFDDMEYFIFYHNNFDFVN